MTDLVLIHPGASHGIYGALGDELVAVEQPLWPRLIAGNARDQGHSVAIIDQELERLSPRAVAERVAVINPRLVAICVYGHQPSASTQQMTGARAVAQAIRDYYRTDLMVTYGADGNGLHRSSPFVVMLGNHPSALPERTLREEPVDYVVDGEGPVTLDGLLRGEPRDTIPGLVWWDGDEITRNPLAPLLDLDCDLHGRAWDLLPEPSHYRAHNWQCFGALDKRSPYAAIYTSLGCAFKCHFCMINTVFHTNRYRTRSPAAVVAEMLELNQKYGVETFKIVDELFVLNRKHYREVCRLLVESGLGERINFWCYARSDTVLEEDLPLLRAAGCRWLALGIESGSKAVLDAARKGDRTVDVVRTVAQIRAAGINVIANYIFGLPTDTLETMQLTLDLALLLNTEFANFYSAMAYPGSPLYDEAVAKGWPLPATWESFSQHNKWTRPLDTEFIGAKEVLQFRDEAFQRYFSSDRYQQMIRNKFGEDTIGHVRGMLDYKLERYLLTGEIK